jgi:peptidoglycan hydrolase-like protein with peptidoglycan-binding domain
MSQSQDMDAINAFFLTAPAKTPDATAKKTAWPLWFNSLGMYDKYFNSDTLDEARSRRNAFNLANVTTPHEQELAVRVMTQSVDVKGPVDPKTGAVGSQIKKQAEAPAKAQGYPIIQQGATGDAVVKWQTFLGIKGDGKFGPGTKTATIAWQKSHALKPDGVVGPATWASAFSSAPSSQESQPGMFAAVFSPNALPKPAAKPAATAPVKQAMAAAIAAPAKKPAGAIAPSTPEVAVQKAGMFSFLPKLPLWAWIASAVGTVVLVKTGHVKPHKFLK